MSGGRRLRMAALACVAVGLGLLAAPATPAAAAGPATKSAWWWRPATASPTSALPPAAPLPGAPVPTTPGTVPGPPTVPAGSVLVEGTPEGATAIAGLTWTLAEGESSPVLTITPSPSSNVPAGAVVLACRASAPWEPPPAQPGSWDAKPLVDCGQSVQGIPAEDGTLTFPLGILVSGTSLDVILVPGTVGETPAGPVGSAFSLSFDTASGAPLVTTGGGAASDDGGFGASGASATGSPSIGGGSSLPSASAFTAPPLVSPALPALEPQEQAPTVPQPVAAGPVQEAAAAGDGDDDTGRRVGFVVLLVGAALGAWAYLKDPEAVGAVTGVGALQRAAAAPAPVTGGLGRFTRARSNPPPTLS